MQAENPTEFSVAECRRQLDVVVNAVDKMDEAVLILESIGFMALGHLPFSNVSAIQDETEQAIEDMESSSDELKAVTLTAIEKHDEFCGYNLKH